jgi:hypothetical protein
MGTVVSWKGGFSCVGMGWVRGVSWMGNGDGLGFGGGFPVENEMRCGLEDHERNVRTGRRKREGSGMKWWEEREGTRE